jgi:hypothetical protein
MEGNQTRWTAIDRPLDFVAVTDHAEYFDAMNICLNEELYRDYPACVRLRGENVSGPCSPILLPPNVIKRHAAGGSLLRGLVF